MTNSNQTNTSSVNANPAKADGQGADMRKIILKDVGSKWGKFSDEDLTALKGKDDLVEQVIAKYGLEKGQAHRDVDALLKGRQF